MKVALSRIYMHDIARCWLDGSAVVRLTARSWQYLDATAAGSNPTATGEMATQAGSRSSFGYIFRNLATRRCSSAFKVHFGRMPVNKPIPADATARKAGVCS